MAFRINDNCISCGTCIRNCKNGAIRVRDDVYTINPERCTECVGWYALPRCIDSCLLCAVEPDPQYKETKDQLLEKWQKLYPQRTPLEI